MFSDLRHYSGTRTPRTQGDRSRRVGVQESSTRSDSLLGDARAIRMGRMHDSNDVDDSAARRVRVGAFGGCFACCTPQPDPPCAVAATALAGQNVRRRTQQSRRTGGSAVKVPTASPQACAPPRAPPPALRFSRQKPPARARRISDLITDLLAPECPRKIRIKIWVHG